MPEISQKGWSPMEGTAAACLLVGMIVLTQRGSVAARTANDQSAAARTATVVPTAPTVAHPTSLTSKKKAVC
jgi:hypothetical protein